MEWSPTGDFEDSPSQVFLNRIEDDCKVHYVNTDNMIILTTADLHLEYTKDSKIFTSKNLQICIDVNETRCIWSPGLKNIGNLKGTTRTLDDTNGEELVLEDGIISRDGWSLIDDSKTLVFDETGWIKPRNNPKNIDWYFFGYGHDYKDALKEYTEVAGKIPIPPKYAFGYWWSRYWNYSESEFKQLVNEMNDYQIPLDVAIIDMDWHETYGLSRHSQNYAPDGSIEGWTGYTWNKDLFPNPKAFLKWLHERGLKVALNLHPASGIAPMEEQYEEFLKEDGTSDPKGYIAYKMADKKWKDTYFKLIIKKLEDEGVDFWWLDWQQYPESKVVEGLSNTWWLNHVFFTEMEKSGKRPLIFHRWGGLGNHRYQVGFSGDTRMTWDSLKYQPYFTATASNVGYGFWSHDIGGHFPNGSDTDPELYLRWLQYGIFSPIVRTHSTKAASIERRFWKFPEHFAKFRDALKLRYELVPYIYNNARIAHETGVSLCRPMYYEHPEDERAYEFKSQYYFGEDILCAPIAEPINSDTGLVEKELWLPEGEWFELCSGESITGNQVLKREYDLAEFPIFVKAGSIIPSFKDSMNITKTMNEIKFTIIPGEESELNYYDDDGITTNYLNGKHSTVKVTHKRIKNKSTVLIYPVKGDYHTVGKYRAVTVDLLNTIPPKRVSLSCHQHYDVEYLADELTTRITFTKDCDLAVELEVEFPEYNQAILNGMKRFFHRFNNVVERLKYTVAKDDWSGTLPNPVHKLQQIPTRVQYFPKTIIDELNQIEPTLAKLFKELEDHPSVPNSVTKWMRRYLNY